MEHVQKDLKTVSLSLQELLTDLSGQPACLPVRLGLLHSLADLLHQLVQLHRGLNQNRAELLPRILTQRHKEKLQEFKSSHSKERIPA